MSYLKVSILREFNGSEYEVILAGEQKDFKVGTELNPSISASLYLSGGKNHITAVEEITAEEYYIERLKEHDWTFAYSDDIRGHIFKKGDAQRKYLDRLQKSIDKDFKIWNQYCHKMFIKE